MNRNYTNRQPQTPRRHQPRNVQFFSQPAYRHVFSMAQTCCLHNYQGKGTIEYIPYSEIEKLVINSSGGNIPGYFSEYDL